MKNQNDINPILMIGNVFYVVISIMPGEINVIGAKKKSLSLYDFFIIFFNIIFNKIYGKCFIKLKLR